MCYEVEDKIYSDILRIYNGELDLCSQRVKDSFDSLAAIIETPEPNDTIREITILSNQISLLGEMLIIRKAALAEENKALARVLD